MIVAGFGFRGAATAASLRSALGRAAGALRVGALAAPEDKTGAPCLKELAAELGVPRLPVSAPALVAAETLTCSPRVHAARGTGSVAEAAALAGAGDGARLLGPRRVSADRLATCAVAVAVGRTGTADPTAGGEGEPP